MLSGVGNQLSTNIYSINGYCMAINRPFYQYGSHIEFIGFKEYYGVPRGHSLSIYARFSGKKRTSMYMYRQKGDYHYIQTRHNDLFLPLQIFSRKT